MLVCEDESTPTQDFGDGINVAFYVLLYGFEDPLNTERRDRREVVAVSVHPSIWVTAPGSSYTRTRVSGGICRVFSDEDWLGG